MNQVGRYTKIFARNRRITNAMPVIAAVSFLCGISYLFKTDMVPAALWLLMAVVWFFNYHWSRRNPFIRLSEAGLHLRATPLAPAKEIAWHQIVNAQRSGPSRLTLYLDSGRRFSIYLVWVDAGARNALIQMVLSTAAEKGANAREGEKR